MKYKCVNCGHEPVINDLSSIRCPKCQYKGLELVEPPKAGTTPSTDLDTVLHKLEQHELGYHHAKQAVLALITQERNKAYQEGYDKARSVYSNSKPDTYGIG